MISKKVIHQPYTPTSFTENNQTNFQITVSIYPFQIISMNNCICIWYTVYLTLRLLNVDILSTSLKATYFRVGCLFLFTLWERNWFIVLFYFMDTLYMYNHEEVSAGKKHHQGIKKL